MNLSNYLLILNLLFFTSSITPSQQELSNKKTDLVAEKKDSTSYSNLFKCVFNASLLSLTLLTSGESKQHELLSFANQYNQNSGSFSETLGKPEKKLSSSAYGYNQNFSSFFSEENNYLVTNKKILEPEEDSEREEDEDVSLAQETENSLLLARKLHLSILKNKSLVKAIIDKNPKVIEILSEKNHADLSSLKNENGHTALDLAIILPSDLERIEDYITTLKLVNENYTFTTNQLNRLLQNCKTLQRENPDKTIELLDFLDEVIRRNTGEIKKKTSIAFWEIYFLRSESLDDSKADENEESEKE